MPDTFIWGKRGNGKTLQAVEKIYFKWLGGYQIWSNLYMHNYFDYNPVTKENGNLHLVDAIDLIKLLLDDKLPNDNIPKLLVLDEIKGQASSRDFMSFVNKHLTDFVSQARKRNFSIIYTDQILSAYDKWIRQMTDTLIRCKAWYLSNGRITDNPKLATDLGWGNKDYPEPIYFEYREATLDADSPEGLTDVRKYYRTRQTARMFYPCYNTKQIITPVSLKGGNNE